MRSETPVKCVGTGSEFKRSLIAKLSNCYIAKMLNEYSLTI